MNLLKKLDVELQKAFEMFFALDQQSGTAAAASSEGHDSVSDAFWNAGGAQMVETVEFTIPGPFRPVPAVLYRPLNRLITTPALVYLHGGGFSSGSHRSNERQLRDIAAAWGGAVISVDYVHAPMHVFPDAILETSSALLWLHEHGTDLGVDGTRLACGGYSAGASIGLGAASELRWPSWLVAMISIAAAINGDVSTDSMQRYGRGDLYPSRQDVEAMFDRYMTLADQKDTRFNVLFADMMQMPPTFIAAAEYDVFLDASVELHRQLESLGQSCQLEIYKGMSHMFFGFSRCVGQAEKCVRDIACYLQQKNPAILQPTSINSSDVRREGQ